MKIDPYNHKDKYLNWKNRIQGEIPGISKKNSNLVLQYLNDMEKGINVSALIKKGSRSYIRLNTLREKMIFFSRNFKAYFGLDDITKIKEEQLIGFFSDMKNGIIKRQDGKQYVSTATHTKVFKAFWHWYQKINRKQGRDLPDITIDLDTRQDKPKWVYLNEEQIRTLCDNSKYEYKVLFTFLYDSGIRSPTELVNMKVSDFLMCIILQVFGIFRFFGFKKTPNQLKKK